MPLSPLPGRFRIARELTGRNQSAIARKGGVSVATISAIENGKIKDLKCTTLIKLCRALGVTPDYLLAFDRDERQLDHSRRSGAAAFYPSQPPEGVEALKCQDCDRILQPGCPHDVFECIRYAYMRGRGLHYLSARYGIKPEIVAQIAVSGK